MKRCNSEGLSSVNFRAEVRQGAWFHCSSSILLNITSSPVCVCLLQHLPLGESPYDHQHFTCSLAVTIVTAAIETVSQERGVFLLSLTVIKRNKLHSVGDRSTFGSLDRLRFIRCFFSTWKRAAAASLRLHGYHTVLCDGVKIPLCRTHPRILHSRFTQCHEHSTCLHTHTHTHFWWFRLSSKFSESTCMRV